MEKDVTEQTGSRFARAAMLEVQRRTREAIDHIARQIEPGMVEEDGVLLARRSLGELGLLKGWHQVCVRFGRNTVREYGNPSEKNVTLGENDIFFIDIGPLWNRHEGDGGATYVCGSDPEMKRARDDVLHLWNQVHHMWQTEGWTGRNLYAFAEKQANLMGWELNLKRMSGHRVGDFPHKQRFDGLLSDVDFCPSPFVWILEMHIRHPTRPFGAFYEDLMLPGE